MLRVVLQAPVAGSYSSGAYGTLPRLRPVTSTLPVWRSVAVFAPTGSNRLPVTVQEPGAVVGCGADSDAEA